MSDEEDYPPIPEGSRKHKLKWHKELPQGVYPTMITPFDEHTMEVDYVMLRALIKWYMDSGATGMFAVCLSSEMFHLTKEERHTITKFVFDTMNGSGPVLATGNFADTIEDQAAEVMEICDMVDCVVLNTNRIANEGDSDEVWRANMQKLLDIVDDDVPLGLYECPVPYKRLLSPKLLRWICETGRFLFLKDTSCDPKELERKIRVARDVSGDTFMDPNFCNLQVYNANIPTLKWTTILSAGGFSGIACNFYTHIIKWACYDVRNDLAPYLFDFLNMGENVIRDKYPKSAKEYIKMAFRVPISTKCRWNDEPLSPQELITLDSLRRKVIEATLKLSMEVYSPKKFLPKDVKPKPGDSLFV